MADIAAGAAMLKKWLVSIATFLVVAIIVAGLVLRASLPEYQGEVEVQGLQQPVSISFDALARPYAIAQNFNEALFAEGWLHGSERLWQMELLRRAGRGRMAEMLGEGMLDTDKELWRMGVPQLAGKLQSNASPRLLEWLDYYVAGVNAAIGKYSVLPPEFLLLSHSVEPWSAEDVFAVGALVAFESGRNYKKELVRMALRKKLGADRFALFVDDHSDRVDYPFVLEAAVLEADVLKADSSEKTGKPVIEPEARSQSVKAEKDIIALLARLEAVDPVQTPLMPSASLGSNGWVVAADKSSTGNPLYAFDSHDKLGLPNLFYEVHLLFTDAKSRKRQLRGWSVPGLPGVISGYNEHIAWGFTNIGDTQDLFIETRSPDDPLLFKEEDGWYQAKTETVAIPVKGQQPVELEIIYTRNGPLISEAPLLSFSWTGHSVGKYSLESILQMNLARNWETFNQAADGLLAPTLNATYADNHGNIGFRTAGVLPLRGAGNGLYPLRGDLLENHWRGQVATNEMPRVLNPHQGYLAAANARVNALNNGSLISADNAPPYRIQRIQDVLGATEKISPEQMQSLQFDWFDGQAAYLLPHLLAALDTEQMADELQPVVSLLRDWHTNPIAGPDSAAALIFQQWYLALLEAVFAEPLGGPLYQKLLDQSYVVNHPLDILITTDRYGQWWPSVKNEVITGALQTAVAGLKEELGEDISAWRLDQKQQVGLQHELAKAEPLLSILFNENPRPWGGTPASVGRANYKYHTPYQVYHGATIRAVADMGVEPVISTVIPGGQSGHPLSEHYSDQFQGWLEGELFPVLSPALFSGLLPAKSLVQSEQVLKLVPAN